MIIECDIVPSSVATEANINIITDLDIIELSTLNYDLPSW